MSEHSAIEWTDATFNPWWGCTKVSPACDHCYAERDAKRFAPGRVLWGAGAERRTFGDAHWQAPLKWAKRAFVRCSSCGWRGFHTKLRHIEGDHECPACSSTDWRAIRMRVFCASMADVFDKDAPAGDRERLFDLILRTPELDWLLLTKRIGNAAAMLPRLVNSFADVFPNVWLGATVVNQEEADRDIPKLLAVPARVRFVSIEPMLGPVDLVRSGALWSDMNGVIRPEYQQMRPHVDWVIAGGESGPKARPAHPDWFCSLRDQCADAGVAFFFKQWGEWAATESRAASPSAIPLNLCRVTSDDPDLSDHYVAVSSDSTTATMLERVGKAAAGRLLDGRVHDAFPEPQR